jgi:Cys-tRNA(Pro)/Cys-tRNA(Cys) deacylase
MGKSKSLEKGKTNAARILEAAKVNYELLESGTGDDFVSGTDMAKIMGVPANQIYKTLVTISSSKNYYVCVIAADHELDLKKAAKVVGEKKIEMLPVKDILQVTGYVKGGCSPIGMKKLYRTLLDENIRSEEQIYISAGRRGQQIKLLPKDLADIVNAKLADIVVS